MLADLYLGFDSENGFELFKSSDIVSAKKNEMGNYVITTIANQSIENEGYNSFVIDYEIDAEGNILSQTINIVGDYSGEVMNGRIVNTYSYGTLQYEDIQEEFEQLINYQE